MKIASLVTLTGLVVTGAVHAQSVTMYGMMDVGVEVLSNTNGVGTVTRMPSTTGIIPSRFGFRGKEDLGSGLSAIYTLEMGFAPDTGASGQGGRLFGRQSTVGFSGDWGAVTLGRQWTMLFWSVLDSDIAGPAVYGLGSLDSYIPNSRVDNSLAYKGKFGNVTVGATYSLGRDTASAPVPNISATNCAGENGADAAACREWSAMVKYDTASWGAALGYDTLNGRTVGAAPADVGVNGGLNSSSKSDTRLMLNGYAKFSDLKLAGGLIRRTNDGAVANRAKTDLWYMGASYPLSPTFTLDGTISKLSYKDVSNFDSTLVTVRGLYKLSKRTTLYAQLGTINNESLVGLSASGGVAGPGSAPALGDSQTGVMLGVNHAF